MAETSGNIRHTPLESRHREAGAKMVEFAGWEMPLHYGSQLSEHRAVREHAGLFDVSHMGELWVEGADAGRGLSAALATDPASLAVGRAGYSLMCTEGGGIVDDLIVYRIEEERFLVVANAANVRTVERELRERLAGLDATVSDSTGTTALVALQGPESERILSGLASFDPSELKAFRVRQGEVGGASATVARTGYTGEDGFELFTGWNDAAGLWDQLIAAGRAAGLVPAGLAARDTLRLEAALPLYGNELDLGTNPFEAGLGRFVQLDREGDFAGRAALTRAAAGTGRTRAGLVLEGRAIARRGAAVFLPGAREPRGVVTSGAPSPTLGKPIALASVLGDRPREGTVSEIEVRGRRVPAEAVRLPFYRRARRNHGDP